MDNNSVRHEIEGWVWRDLPLFIPWPLAGWGYMEGSIGGWLYHKGSGRLDEFRTEKLEPGTPKSEIWLRKMQFYYPKTAFFLGIVQTCNCISIKLDGLTYWLSARCDGQQLKMANNAQSYHSTSTQFPQNPSKNNTTKQFLCSLYLIIVGLITILKAVKLAIIAIIFNNLSKTWN